MSWSWYDPWSCWVAEKSWKISICFLSSTFFPAFQVVLENHSPNNRIYFVAQQMYRFLARADWLAQSQLSPFRPNGGFAPILFTVTSPRIEISESGGLTGARMPPRVEAASKMGELPHQLNEKTNLDHRKNMMSCETLEVLMAWRGAHQWNRPNSKLNTRHYVWKLPLWWHAFDLQVDYKTRCSPRTRMQSRRTLLWNKLFEQSTCFPMQKRVECKACVECRV